MTTVAVLGDGLLARSIMDVLAESELGGGYAVMLSHSDFDIRFTESIVRALQPHKPDVLINTVAFHSLAACEQRREDAFEINARGAERVARIAPTIYVSTDYVFHDGGPHDEAMPGRQPASVYGRSKLAGELATLERDGVVVRVSGLYHHEYQSHKGPSFPDVILGGYSPIKLPSDQKFSPTYAPDAARRIAGLALSRIGLCSSLCEKEDDHQTAGIYHAANRGTTSWAEFAEQIVSVGRHKRTILPHEAKDPIRPKNSALRSKRLPQLDHWAGGLNRWALARGLIGATSPLR